MKKEQLAKRLAKESGISTAAAADQLDGILSGILRRVRTGTQRAPSWVRNLPAGRET